jgi:branched-subunit amino acid ABC-type transport system permease component
MHTFLNALVRGIADGAVYSLIALPFALLVRSTRVFNLAQADISVLGILIAVEFGSSSRLGLLLAAVIAMAAGAVIGAGTHTFAIRPLRRRREELYGPLVATLAVSIILETFMLLRYGDVPAQLAQNPISGRIGLGGYGNITVYELILVGLALALGVVGELWIRRADMGLKWRAMGEEPTLAASRGIYLRRTELISFIVAGVASGLVGVLVATEVPVVYSSGLSLALTVFLVLGFVGADNLGVVALGGIGIGCLEQLLTAYTSASITQVCEVALLLVWLLIFPAGGLSRVGLRRV